MEKYDRQELANLDTLQSGDLVEVELEIDSKNDYEYFMFEDLKAAGFEPVELRSGYGGNSLGAYVEMRDNRVTFFLRQSRGVRTRFGIVASRTLAAWRLPATARP